MNSATHAVIIVWSTGALAYLWAVCFAGAVNDVAAWMEVET